MSFTVNDKRGNYDAEPEITDDAVLGIITYSCMQTLQPIPKPLLTEQGITDKQLERMVKDGKLSRIPVYNGKGQMVYAYYPASFEAYKVPRNQDTVGFYEDDDAEEIKR